MRHLFLACFVLLAWVLPASAQVVFDSASGQSVGLGLVDTGTISSVVVSGGANRAMFVMCAVDDSNADITDITFNTSESFTFHGKFTMAVATFHDIVEVWYLLNPTATTANVVVNWDIAHDGGGCGAWVFTGVHQTSPLGTVDGSGAAATTTSCALSVEDGVAGDLIISAVGSSTGDFVDLAIDDGAITWTHATQQRPAAGGLTTVTGDPQAITWSWTPGEFNACLGVAVKAAEVAASGLPIGSRTRLGVGL